MNETAKFLEDLFSTYYDSLVKVARRRTSDWALAEDMVQSTMETALDNIEKVKTAPSVKGWLILTLKNKLNRELDNAYHKHEVTSEDVSFVGQSGSNLSEDKSLSLEGLDEVLPASCPPRFREILNLRYVEKLQYNEIGECLGITPGAAQQRLFKAHQWLRDFFNRHGMTYGT